MGYVYDPDLVNAYTAYLGMGYSAADAADILAEKKREYDASLAWERESAATTAANELKIAEMRLAEARASSGADRSARIAAAQASLEAARIDAAARIKVAGIEAATQRRYYEAQIAAKGPGGWVERSYWDRGAQAPAATPTQTQGYTQWAQGGVAPQAVVGERGPELATATPQGTVITPLNQRTARGFGGVGMAGGGVIRTPNPFLTGRLQDYARAQRAGGQRLMGLSGAATDYMQRLAAMPKWQSFADWQGANPEGTRQQWQQAIRQQPPMSTMFIRPEYANRIRLPQYRPPATMAQGGLVRYGASNPITGSNIPGANWSGYTNPQGPPAGPQTDQEIQNQPWLRYIQEGRKPAMFSAWGGTQTSRLGYNIKPPHTMNYDYFQQLSLDEQAQALAAWQDVYGFTPENSVEQMRRASFAGSATGEPVGIR